MVHDTLNEHVDGHPTVPYFSIFIAFCISTLVSVLFGVLHFPSLLLMALVLSVAVAQTLFVMIYFMHLKFEGHWKFIILAPTTILAMGLIVGLVPDIAMSYYRRDVPQVRILAELQSQENADKIPAPNANH